MFLRSLINSMWFPIAVLILKMYRNKLFFAATALTFAAVVFFLYVFTMLRHGFDFTDEGFYLNLIAYPSLYNDTVYQFGLIYHLVFRLMNEDIARLRQFNIGFTWTLAMISFFMLLNEKYERRSVKIFNFAISFCLSISCLLYLAYFWLPTPSYNSLAMQGLFVVVIGLIIIFLRKEYSQNEKYSEIIGIILIGIGGAVVFLAKPPSAALLAILILPVAFVLLEKSFAKLIIAPIVASGIIISIAFYLDGGVLSFIERYRKGIEFVSALVPDSSFIEMFERFEWLHIDNSHLYVMWICALLAFFNLCLISTRLKFFGSFNIILASIGSVLFVILILLMPDMFHFLPQHRSGSYMNFAIAPSLFCISVFSIFFLSLRASNRRLLATIVLVFFLVLTPIIFSFGTSNSVTTQALAAVIFWTVAVAVLVREGLRGEIRHFALLTTAIAVVPVTAWLVMSSMEKPYRQNLALRLQLEPTIVGKAATPLFVDAVVSDYIRSLRNVIGESVDQPLMLDFTGLHPGAIFAAGGRPIGLPWMVGGYDGSALLVDRALRKIPCDLLAGTWLLTSPETPHSIPEQLLVQNGLENHWIEVKSFRGPMNRSPRVHRLFSPPSDTSIGANSCLRVRARAAHSPP